MFSFFSLLSFLAEKKLRAYSKTTPSFFDS